VLGSCFVDQNLAANTGEILGIERPMSTAREDIVLKFNALKTKAAPLAALCGALLAFSAVSAVTAPALATAKVNLRRGPGTTYTVIMTIPGGSNVDVSGGNDGWCQVAFGGQNGFAIASSIDQGGGAAPPGAGGPHPNKVPAAHHRRHPVMPDSLVTPDRPITVTRLSMSGRDPARFHRRRSIMAATAPITAMGPTTVTDLITAAGAGAGKPDFRLSMIFAENRLPLFGIML
jgi:hypothetical protein